MEKQTENGRQNTKRKTQY